MRSAVLRTAGRPMTLDWSVHNPNHLVVGLSDAMVALWDLGAEQGRGVNELFQRANPSARSVPHSEITLSPHVKKMREQESCKK